MSGIKFQHFQYVKSERKGIYDKIQSDEPYLFDFLKFEPPRDERLINAGVSDVMMSFNKQRKKSLHTGIIPIDRNLFIGNNINDKGRKDFLFLNYHTETEILHLWYFPDRNPKNKLRFCLDILNEHFYNIN